MFNNSGKITYGALFFIIPIMVFLCSGVAVAHFNGTNHIHPDTIYKTLCPGECFEEDKQVDLEGAPAMGDIFFAFDCTGSMSGILDTAKTKAVDIMNSIRVLIPDTQFVVMSHRDYDNTYYSCDYSGSYGNTGDWPYDLVTNLTSDTATVSGGIATLGAGGGADGAESYIRVLYESYADTSIRWRFKSKKILINFLDNIPHDCDVYKCLGGAPYSQGKDPGRDALVDTADDLPILNVVDTMLKKGITMLTVCMSSFYIDIWDCYAKRTGGSAYEISDPSEVPTAVKDLIEEDLSTITILELVAEPGYEDWLDSVTPTFYLNTVLDTPKSLTFHIKICMPRDTPPGVYTFHIYAVGDGAVYGEQEITVRHCNLIVPTSSPTPTPTPTGTWAADTVTPTPVTHLNCASAVDVPCGGGTFVGNTATGVNNVSAYSPCSTWNESGKEIVYRVITDIAGDIVARFKATSTDLDLFILGSCDENDCIASGNNSAEARGVPPGTYYVVVDGYLGNVGAYTLEIDAPCGSIVPVSNGVWFIILSIAIFLVSLRYMRK